MSPNKTKHSDGCEWSVTGSAEWFQSDCGFSFDFLDEGPIEAGFKFCPFCGKAIKAALTHKVEETK